MNSDRDASEAKLWARRGGNRWTAAGDDWGEGELPEDVPDNQENGRRGLPGQSREGRAALIRQAHQGGFLGDGR